MGFFSRFRRGVRDGVRGEATVVKCSVTQMLDGSKRRLTLELAVRAAGIDPANVTHECKDFDGIVPAPMTVLPVRVDRDDPTRLEVLWHEVPPSVTLGDVDPLRGQRLRDLIDAVESDPDRIKGAHVIRTFTSTSMGPAMIDGEPFDADNPKQVEFMRLVESAIGVDLDGDGVVSEAPEQLPPPHPPPPPAFPPPDVDDDPLERVRALEQLAALRDSGTLTDDEFESEKARLLEG